MMEIANQQKDACTELFGKKKKKKSERHDLILVRTVMLESAFLDECSGTRTTSTKLNGNIKGNVTMAELLLSHGTTEMLTRCNPFSSHGAGINNITKAYYLNTTKPNCIRKCTASQ